MYADNFAPDNNRTGEMNQAEIIISLFFKTNQQLAETIKKRVCCFHNSPAGFKCGIAFDFFLLITAGPYICNITLTFNRLFSTCIASVQAQMLWLRYGWLRAKNHNAIQSLPQQFNVVRICTGQHN